MNFNTDYYSILGVNRTATEKEIKKNYYKLSFIHHPDKGGDQIIFNQITEAYDVLSGENRLEYDNRSIYGNSYDESLQFLEYEFNNFGKIWNENTYDSWKKDNQLNIIIYIDDSFNGTIEYERWVICKECGGNGKDNKSKIAIKDENGNIIKYFEGSDGCDFCDGTGKDYNGNICYFCNGDGKVGWSDCKVCHGKRKILGKQKLKGIKFPKDKKSHKIEAMGHASTIEWGKVGCVWLVRN